MNFSTQNKWYYKLFKYTYSSWKKKKTLKLTYLESYTVLDPRHDERVLFDLRKGFLSTR